MGKNVILVIDDDYAFTDFAKLLLESLGHSAITCLQGAMAVDMALVHRPDIIITDLNMDDLDGLEVVTQLKARKETKHIPVILASSSTDRTDRAEGLKRGAVYSVVKPLEKEALRRLIQRLTA